MAETAMTLSGAIREIGQRQWRGRPVRRVLRYSPVASKKRMPAVSALYNGPPESKSVMVETSAENSKNTSLELLDVVVARARKAGADAADAVLFDAAALSVSYRLGARESVERSESRDLGLRVLIGRRQGLVSSSDTSERALDELVERAVAMAKAATEDPYCGLAAADRLAVDIPDLDLFDAEEPSTDTLVERAAAAEDAARAVTGITNSEGADAGWGRTGVALATSHGFRGAYQTSRHGVSVAVIAGAGTAMERDWEYSSARHTSDLDKPADIGRRAAERAMRRLGARKIASAQVPIVFEPRVANSLVRHFSSAITGTAVARGTSFLRDRMDEPVFGDRIEIIDDPHRPRGLASKPFDGEGVATRRHVLIDNGKLTTWLLDSSCARQLGLETTGHAGRDTGSPPSPGNSNLYLAAGEPTPTALLADIEQGLYVTELIGFGVNPVTGDYSRGASGFWIEHGELGYPVSELTIAGNLKDMFKALSPADDLEFRRGVDAPTVRVDGMTVAGT